MKEYRDIFTSPIPDESERLIGCLQFCSFLSLSSFNDENYDLSKLNDAAVANLETEKADDLRNLSSNHLSLKTEDQKYLLKSLLKGSLYKGMIASHCSCETTLVKKLMMIISRFIEFHER
jgi:hypothetical protein